MLHKHAMWVAVAPSSPCKLYFHSKIAAKCIVCSFNSHGLKEDILASCDNKDGFKSRQNASISGHKFVLWTTKHGGLVVQFMLHGQRVVGSNLPVGALGIGLKGLRPTSFFKACVKRKRNHELLKLFTISRALGMQYMINLLTENLAPMAHCRWDYFSYSPIWRSRES